MKSTSMKYHLNTIISCSLLCCLIACGSNNDSSGNSNPVSAHKGHIMPPEAGNYCDSVNAGLIQPDTLKGSPVRTAMATVNGTHVHIEYGSPGVKDRIIWGGLVAYDKVWATGAHNATSIQFSKPVVIGGKTIPQGTYGFFTIPGKTSWQVILNSRFEQHLTDDYSATEDVISVNVEPRQSPMVQRLTYVVMPTVDGEGEIIMRWEKLEIILPFITIAP
jgi:hypothetical protein